MKLHYKIQRGSNEIGGSCVEIWTEQTRILVDFGLPLIDRNGDDFDFKKYSSMNIQELVMNKVLPNIDGLYDINKKPIDAVIISHAHQDHFGLSSFIDDRIPFYLSRATHKIIELNNMFSPQNIHLKKTVYFEKNEIFEIGDISITPYLMDHSAFDSFAFHIEANGESIFYSGDFRNHGRKSKSFKWFSHNSPKDVDYLLLEGTNIGRDDYKPKTESEIEQELVDLFKQEKKINLIYTSGQNIDRLVSIYRACLRSNKLLVIDVYVATILKELSSFAKLPYPSEEYQNLKVFFPYFTSRRLSIEGNNKVLYKFKNYKITKEEIAEKQNDIVMMIRPSMQNDLQRISGLEGGNIIYSMWEGYLEKPTTKRFMNFLKNKNFSLIKIHTSGHADIKTLKKMAEVIQPKEIVPIHTFSPSKYENLCQTPIVSKLKGTGQFS